MQDAAHDTNVIGLPLAAGRLQASRDRHANEADERPRRQQPKRGAAQPAFRADSPEQRLRMKRTDALDLFEPLPLPPTWRVYITAPAGEVAARMAGCGRLLRAALLLQELGTVQLAQRRTEHGTEYLIRRSFR